jgi:hypothetical protein
MKILYREILYTEKFDDEEDFLESYSDYFEDFDECKIVFDELGYENKISGTILSNALNAVEGHSLDKISIYVNRDREIDYIDIMICQE